MRSKRLPAPESGSDLSANSMSVSDDLNYFYSALDNAAPGVYNKPVDAGWSSPVARWAHNPKVVRSSRTPAPKWEALRTFVLRAFFHFRSRSDAVLPGR